MMIPSKHRINTTVAFVIHPQSLTCARLIVGVSSNSRGIAAAGSNSSSSHNRGSHHHPCYRRRHEKIQNGQPQYGFGKKNQRLPSSSHLFSTQDNQDHNNNKKNNIITNKDENELSKKKEEPINISEKFSAFVEMAFPYYKESISGRWLFAGMIAMTLLNSGVSVAFSYVGKDFWNALNSKDTEQFYVMLWRYAAALLVGSPVSVLYTFQRERLAVSWREWMTDRCLQLYSSNRVYYNLERGSGSGSNIDNPDQRITEDVRSFTAFSLTLFLTLLTSLIDLVSFSLILYSIQPQLFGAIAIYALFGTVTTSALGKKLIGLNYQKLQKEADFRYSLVRIRDNAESIAFYAGEDIENKEVVKRLEKVIDNRKEINVAQRNVEFFTTSYNYFVQILPVWVVAPQYFSGAIQLGVVSQSAGAFNHVLRDLSVIVNQFEQLSSFSAAIDRLHSFMVAIRDADDGRTQQDGLLQLPANANATVDVELVTSPPPTPVTESIHVTPPPLPHNTLEKKSSTIQLSQMQPMGSDMFFNTATVGPIQVLDIANVTLTTPDGKRTLITNLNFSIQEGEHLLIVGNSGAGKSSLLRAIAGLWKSGCGSIQRPSDEDVYFLPQRPYCALGSLKDQLLYPSLDQINTEDYPEGHRLSKSHMLRQTLSDQDLLDILDQVDLSELASRAGDGDPIRGLHTVMDWSNTLSLGEQQRLAFGRLLVNQPRFVILDEATSALDMVAEAKMYQLLQNKAQRRLVPGGKGLSRAGMTYVSVGHRPSLLAYHNTRLRLMGSDGFAVEAIDTSSLDVANKLGVSNM